MSVDYFLKLEGIEGESQDDAHRDEIDILSWSWGMSQSGTMHVARGGGAGKVSVSDLNIVKFVDKASPILAQRNASGKHIPKGTLVCRKAGESPLEYLTIKLENILISSYNVGGSDGDERLSENVSLNFAKCEYSYVPQMDDGTGGPEVIFSLNIPTNVVT